MIWVFDESITLCIPVMLILPDILKSVQENLPVKSNQQKMNKTADIYRQESNFYLSGQPCIIFKLNATNLPSFLSILLVFFVCLLSFVQIFSLCISCVLCQLQHKSVVLNVESTELIPTLHKTLVRQQTSQPPNCQSNLSWTYTTTVYT